MNEKLSDWIYRRLAKGLAMDRDEILRQQLIEIANKEKLKGN